MHSALVVDDNRMTADSLVRVLKALNFDARAAYGPGPGMSILNSEVPDVVFLDINMPGLTGFEILGFLSREPRFAKVPVFIVTSDDQPETRQRALKSGARDLLVKPVSVEGLESALKKAGLLK